MRSQTAFLFSLSLSLSLSPHTITQTNARCYSIARFCVNRRLATWDSWNWCLQHKILCTQEERFPEVVITSCIANFLRGKFWILPLILNFLLKHPTGIRNWHERNRKASVIIYVCRVVTHETETKLYLDVPQDSYSLFLFTFGRDFLFPVFRFVRQRRGEMARCFVVFFSVLGIFWFIYFFSDLFSGKMAAFIKL